ncbi:MAG: YhjD/YihY/BrkB family envelope integrity protein [Pseudomonadota bacterium]|nr:YhjD/YihY/BrkB family envelope integrity protein [Pseudomonadota bacterium]
MAIIFHQPDNPRRSFWVSAILPYAFILVLGIGLLTITVLFAIASTIYENPAFVLDILSFVSVFLLFSAIYKVLPIVRIAPKRAVVGGLVAAILWEATRLLLIYYFRNISLVGAVYGSLATIIVVLISLEIAAIILLLGGQVIAELERSARHGLPWYESPG